MERNFALLQAAENYAKTAEQIWLSAHPNEAQDAVGNTSAASTALSASTTVVGGNKVAVYYKYPSTWTTIPPRQRCQRV